MEHRCRKPQGRALPQVAEELRRRARRLTGPRQAIISVLARQSHPVSAKEIYDALPAGDCDLATVYRSLHLLEGLGIVKRYDLGDGAARFELLAEGDDGHHHHLVCIRCSGVVEIDQCLMQDIDEKIGRENGYHCVTHRLEFFGVCPSCQS